MLQVDGLGRWFDHFHAVRGVSFEARQGEILALLGPNGAGKSTIVRMLTAVLPPSYGSASVAGFDVRHQGKYVRARVGLLTEFPGLYERMRPMEYLSFFGTMHGMRPERALERARSLLDRFGLASSSERRMASFSKGMKQKMALLRAIMHEPDVLFLDEPTTAMDPESSALVRDAIAQIRHQQRTVILTSHNLAEVAALADRIVIIAHGQIIAAGDLASMQSTVLGPTRWTIRVVSRGQEAAGLIADLVQIDSISATAITYHAAHANEAQPHLLRRLILAGIDVISVEPHRQDLEEIYLELLRRHSESEDRHAFTTGVVSHPA